MAGILICLGDFAAVGEPAARQDGDLAQISEYWNSGVVAGTVNPYRVELTAAAADNDETTRQPA